MTFKKIIKFTNSETTHPSLTGLSSPPKVSQMSKGDLQAESRLPSIRSRHTLRQQHPNQGRTKLRNLQGSVQKENAGPHVQKLLRISRLKLQSIKPCPRPKCGALCYRTGCVPRTLALASGSVPSFALPCSNALSPWGAGGNLLSLPHE